MKDKVKESYEEGDYHSNYREGREVRRKEKELFQKLLERVLEEPRVLDLGCGTGVPFDRYLADKGCDVLGVDIAENHVSMARKNVPEAEFVVGDFFEQDLETGSFDAIVSMYAIFHIPRRQHRELFEKMREWLAEEGAILVTLGAEAMENFSEEIGGEEMYWSSYSPEKSIEMLEESGFEVVEIYDEDYRDEPHFWVLANTTRR